MADLTRDVTLDEVVVTDVGARDTSSVRAQADTSVVTDSVAQTRQTNADVSDTAAVTDFADAAEKLYGVASDTAAVTDGAAETLSIEAIRMSGQGPSDVISSVTDGVVRAQTAIRAKTDTAVVSDAVAVDRVSACPADTVAALDDLMVEHQLRRKTPLHLGTGYKELFSIGNPVSVDADTLDPALILPARRFNADFAPFVEFYWDVSPRAAGDKASFKILKWDGAAQAFTLSDVITDLAPCEIMQISSDPGNIMAILVTSVTATGLKAKNVSVRAAQRYTLGVA